MTEKFHGPRRISGYRNQSGMILRCMGDAVENGGAEVEDIERQPVKEMKQVERRFANRPRTV